MEAHSLPHAERDEPEQQSDQVDGESPPAETNGADVFFAEYALISQ